jgi:hypothetical protein
MPCTCGAHAPTRPYAPTCTALHCTALHCGTQALQGGTKWSCTMHATCASFRVSPHSPHSPHSFYISHTSHTPLTCSSGLTGPPRGAHSSSGHVAGSGRLLLMLMGPTHTAVLRLPPFCPSLALARSWAASAQSSTAQSYGVWQHTVAAGHSTKKLLHRT